MGATIYRKGIDILLDAYTSEFSRDDDVCLVIKDNKQDVFYKNISYQEKIQSILQNPKSPEVLHINSFLAAADLANLYRTCDVGVFPYRAEGFAIPIAELMASGIPSIVPDFGASRDYTNSQNAFKIPAKNIKLPVGGRFKINTLNFTEEVDSVNFCEVDPDVLGENMREIFQLNADEIGKKGLAGRKFIKDNFSEDLIFEKMISAIEEII